MRDIPNNQQTSSKIYLLSKTNLSGLENCLICKVMQDDPPQFDSAMAEHEDAQFYEENKVG
jgi:hypothetical protein